MYSRPEGSPEPTSTARPAEPGDGRSFHPESLLLRRNPQPAARFALFYQRLRAMPRPWQRRLRRKLALTLAGAALLLALSGAPAQAATITVVNGEVAVVANGKCSLIEAIQNANSTTNGRPNADCAAGNPSGADVINLPANGLFTLTTAVNAADQIGLPWITSNVTINGNGSTIRRANTTEEFRILAVGQQGVLTLNNATISAGKVGFRYSEDYDSYGGGLLNRGRVTLSGSTVSNNYATNGGGGIFNDVTGEVTLNNSTVSGNEGNNMTFLGTAGGGILNRGDLFVMNSVIRDNSASAEYESDGGGIANRGEAVIIDSIVSGNTVSVGHYGDGGGISNVGTLTIQSTVLHNNTVDAAWSAEGGAISHAFNGQLTISNSTFQNNESNDSYGSGGGALSLRANATITGSIFVSNIAEDRYYNESVGGAIWIGNGWIGNGNATIINSTFSGNSADQGGAVYNNGQVTLTNSTIANNTGGGVFAGCYGDSMITRLQRSIFSGNSGSEVRIGPATNCTNTVIANSHNIFGHSGNAGVSGFTPGPTDIVPSVGLSAILGPLADNGGPTLTHALPSGSPAIDRAPNSACTAAPVNGIDQRGLPRNVDGNGAASANECDVGAFELQPGGPSTVYFMTVTAAGTTADGVSFDKRDVLKWDGARWSLFFDGSARGLPGTADISAVRVPGANSPDMLFAFAKAVTLPNAGKVMPHDVVRFDGSAYAFQFDGSDVGLSTTGEKIDALHQLPGNVSPIGSGCNKYFLISTTGSGSVPNHTGGTLKFAGEDVLGFCATSVGNATAGLWHLVMDGSDEGLPAGATFSLSSNADAGVLYLTTKGTFTADGISGNHSNVYKFDKATGRFSGPVFRPANNGLAVKVDGLELAGTLP